MSPALSSLFSSLSSGDIAMLGICSDANSSFMRGPADAPEVIREVLYSGAANLSAETGISLNAHAAFKDLGDHLVEDSVADFLRISEPVGRILRAGAKPLLLGGDHAITFPAIKAFFDHMGPVDILHFDAHADIYHDFEGNPYSHASPFARIMESGMAVNLTQIGIRTLNQHQREQIEKFGVNAIEMREFDLDKLKLKFENPLYLSFDLDALDPAFAPGVSHHEPGGLTVREVINIIQRLPVPLVGADIVEYNPKRDLNQMTAAVAAKLVKEVSSAMLTNRTQLAGEIG